MNRSVRQFSQKQELAHGVLVEERRSRVVAPVAGDHAPAFFHELERDVHLCERQVECCGERIERHDLAPAPAPGSVTPGSVTPGNIVWISGGKGANKATGVPRSVTMMVSPSAARPTYRPRCAFKSLIPIVTINFCLKRTLNHYK